MASNIEEIKKKLGLNGSFYTPPKKEIKEKEEEIKEVKENYDESNCGIYKWTNLKENKSYIGQSKNLARRKREFLAFNRSRAYTSVTSEIDSVRRKYNDEKYWNYEVLELCPPNELNEREIFHIDENKTSNLKFGYNKNISEILYAREIQIDNEIKELKWQQKRGKDYDYNKLNILLSKQTDLEKLIEKYGKKDEKDTAIILVDAINRLKGINSSYYGYGIWELKFESIKAYNHFMWAIKYDYISLKNDWRFTNKPIEISYDDEYLTMTLNHRNHQITYEKDSICRLASQIEEFANSRYNQLDKILKELKNETEVI